MNSMSRAHRQDLKTCKTETISNCGLTVAQLENLVGKPAGTTKPDTANPAFKNKVVFSNGKLTINLAYILTGNIYRAETGLKNIKEVYAKAGITINFAPNASKFDIRIHGATLAEIVQGLKLCSCEAGLYIGGWAPAPTHYKWGNALLLGSTPPRSTWKLTDAHEFGHKLGLKHRSDLGIMDYPPKPGKRDRRKFTASDRQRIIDLYK
ncbi:MAG TPA: hypothetical protein VL987_10960 [Cellvibrio sp.]|nr:hypothetical protein [Cellvibrio sp.]